MDALLKAGGSLTAYRANPLIGIGPRQGSWADRLENEIENRFHVHHAVALNSGTAALHCALAALALQPGAEVITSPISFSATAAAVVLAGYVPVFADVDSDTFTLSLKTVKRAITQRTQAILPVHLFGQMAVTDELASLGLPIVEDACQAVGSKRKGIYSGCAGLAGAYSFGGTKQVPAGEGGCLVTNSNAVARSARLLANHAENFNVDSVGYNYRPSEVTCCIAWHGLKALKDNTPFAIPYLVKERGPSDKPYINRPLHKMPAFTKYARGPLPVAERLCERTLCIRPS